MKAINLTPELLKKLDPKAIIYAEFAEGGAMGACGTARIFTVEAGTLKFYLVEDIFSNEDNQDIWAEVSNYLRSLELRHIITHAYAGYGNHAYKPSRLDFSRDDDNAMFIYEKDGKTYKIPASCQGVYDCIAATFATRDVPLDAIEHYFHSRVDGTSPPEWVFVSEYLKQLRRADAGESWFDFTALDYLNAVSYLRHLDGTDYILSDVERATCESALQKYRLKYVVDHLGWNKLNHIVNSLVIHNNTGLFAKISQALGEDVEAVYSVLETVKSSHSGTGIFDDDSIEQLFSRPVLVEFTKSAHTTIIKEIVNGSGSSFNPHGKKVAYYLAGYILNEDKLPYSDILPAVVHIVETMPTDDFNHTHTDQLFWLCGNIIDRAWRYLEEDDATQEQYRDLVYGIYWPRVGSLWPVLHGDEFEFKHESAAKIFNDSLGFVMSLDDIAQRNREIEAFLKANAEHVGYNAGPLGRRAFVYTLKGLTPEQEFTKILDAIEPQDYDAFLAYPNSTKEAKLLMAELFRTDPDARIVGRNRLAVFEAVTMTPNTMCVGEYILNYIDLHFDDYAKIISTEAINLGAEPLEVLTDFYIAMSKGITEENEFLPFKSIKAKLAGLGCDPAKLDAAEKYARHHRRTILFQRSALQKFF